MFTSDLIDRRLTRPGGGVSSGASQCPFPADVTGTETKQLNILNDSSLHCFDCISQIRLRYYACRTIHTCALKTLTITQICRVRSIFPSLINLT